MSLLIAPCSHDAAKFSVTHYHYSNVMPSGKLVKFGVWEDGSFVGCVIFSRGATNNIGRPYNLEQTSICELTRVALTRHKSSVSRIIKIAIKLLKKQSPGLRLVVSYADPEQGHYGTVYQAGGWIYTGKTDAQPEIYFQHRVVHKRSINAKYGSVRGFTYSDIAWKHKYILPLDLDMGQQVARLKRPYPKRVGSIESDATAIQAD